MKKFNDFLYESEVETKLENDVDMTSELEEITVEDMADDLKEVFDEYLSDEPMLVDAVMDLISSVLVNDPNLIIDIYDKLDDYIDEDNEEEIEENVEIDEVTPKKVRRNKRLQLKRRQEYRKKKSKIKQKLKKYRRSSKYKMYLKKKKRMAKVGKTVTGKRIRKFTN